MSIQLETLREAGEDGGHFMGYWAKGTHDKAEFARLCNIDMSTDQKAGKWLLVTKTMVKHEIWRMVPIRGHSGSYMFAKADKKGRGAFEVTTVNMVWEYLLNEQRYRDQGFEEGMRVGLNEAGYFSFDWLKKNCTPERAEQFLSRVEWQAWRSEREKFWKDQHENNLKKMESQ